MKNPHRQRIFGNKRPSIPKNFVDPGGPVVIILATDPRFAGLNFKPGQGRWIVSQQKIRSMISFGRK